MCILVPSNLRCFNLYCVALSICVVQSLLFFKPSFKYIQKSGLIVVTNFFKCKVKSSIFKYKKNYLPIPVKKRKKKNSGSSDDANEFKSGSAVVDR